MIIISIARLVSNGPVLCQGRAPRLLRDRQYCASRYNEENLHTENFGQILRILRMAKWRGCLNVV